jgi:hypothetical protein
VKNRDQQFQVTMCCDLSGCCVLWIVGPGWSFGGRSPRELTHVAAVVGGGAVDADDREHDGPTRVGASRDPPKFLGSVVEKTVDSALSGLGLGVASIL